MRILQTYRETYADGPGIRYAIYVSGCDLKCKGCHNPESWAFSKGEPLSLLTLSRIKSDIRSNPLLTGITISGGDPLHQDNAYGLLLLLEHLQEFDKHIMTFTGHTAEQLIGHPANDAQRQCLQYIDILVDGPYVESLHDTSSFRGSTNQRFIRTKDMFKNHDLKVSKINDYIIPTL